MLCPASIISGVTSIFPSSVSPACPDSRTMPNPLTQVHNRPNSYALTQSIAIQCGTPCHAGGRRQERLVLGNTSCECLVLRERILSEIKRLAAATGKPPGVAAFTRDTGIAQSNWYGVIWARWSDALSEAGLQSNTLQGRFDSAAVLRRLAEISRDRKAVPTTPEIKILRRSDLSMPNPKTITAHFGNREELMEALREFCIENEGFESLLSSLPISQRNKSKPPRQTVQGVTAQVSVIGRRGREGV